MEMTASPNATGDPAHLVTALAKASNARVTGCVFAKAGLDVFGTVSSGAASDIWSLSFIFYSQHATEERDLATVPFDKPASCLPGTRFSYRFFILG
jgi:hypothetical protein